MGCANTWPELRKAEKLRAVGERKMGGCDVHHALVWLARQPTEINGSNGYLYSQLHDIKQREDLAIVNLLGSLTPARRQSFSSDIVQSPDIAPARNTTPLSHSGSAVSRLHQPHFLLRLRGLEPLT